MTPFLFFRSLLRFFVTSGDFLSRFRGMMNTPQIAPLSSLQTKWKAGLAVPFLGVAIFDTARLTTRSFI
jgi:hypothetical protein